MDILLTAADGHQIGTVVVQPVKRPRATVIVLHEVFGLTDHIKSVCMDFAAQGYVAVAPTLFSRAVGRSEGVVFDQDMKGMEAGRALVKATPKEHFVDCVRLCVEWSHGQNLPAAVVGYSLGGGCAYVAATHLGGLKACIAYYGGWLKDMAALGHPACPRMVHLAAQDRLIPLEPTKEALERYDPGCEVFVYDADHGFNRDDGRTFDLAAAALARQRTLDLIERSIK